jgi:hypothetical protein
MRVEHVFAVTVLSLRTPMQSRCGARQLRPSPRSIRACLRRPGRRGDAGLAAEGRVNAADGAAQPAPLQHHRHQVQPLRQALEAAFAARPRGAAREGRSCAIEDLVVDRLVAEVVRLPAAQAVSRSPGPSPREAVLSPARLSGGSTRSLPLSPSTRTFMNTLKAVGMRIRLHAPGRQRLRKVAEAAAVRRGSP